MLNDIWQKGVTRNYNTKPGEKLNGPLKKLYQNHTNFKNVAPQVRYTFQEIILTSHAILFQSDTEDERNGPCINDNTESN